MSCSKITLIGLYNYDPTIFDNLTFPAGIVKDVAINEILLKSGEFEIVYPDPAFLKAMITHWGTKNFRTFEKWIEALSLEFNPLYNYDRYEEYSDSRTRQDERNTSDNRSRSDSRNMSDSRSASDSRNRSDNLSRSDSRDTTDERTHSDIKAHSDINSRSDVKEIVGNSETLAETHSVTDDDTTDTKSVSAYDSSAYQPKEQSVINKDISTTNDDSSISSNQSKESTTGSENLSGNESAQGNESGKTTENTSGVENGISNESGNASESGNTSESGNAIESGNASEHAKENELTQHSAHLFGNIGVTTSTALLEDFLRVERFNIYEQIADIFITEFCVLVYE